MPVKIDQDSQIEQFTNEQMRTAHELAERGEVTIWKETHAMGLQLIEDGASFIAVFDRSGAIIGDWIV